MQKGYTPSYREIGAEIGIASPNAVKKHIDALKAKGYLEEAENKKDRVKISDKFSQMAMNVEDGLMVPLMGTVAAGSPIDVYQYQENIVIPRTMVSSTKYGQLFALEVHGNSMIEEGIFEGDIIICEPAVEVKNGDTVVAIVDNDGATLKKYYKERRWVRLMPANSSMEPILSRNVQVQGIVKAVIRKYQ